MGSDDILYPNTLHTNLAKYVSAADDGLEGDLYPAFEAEVDRTPEEVSDEYNTLLAEYLSELAGMTDTLESADDMRERLLDEIYVGVYSAWRELREYYESPGATYSEMVAWESPWNVSEFEDASVPCWRSI